jgi:tetratricopeptide (TPR) repeat protein
MGDVELDAPDLDVDEEASRFRRLVALGVVLITLFGAIVSYAQAVESNDEDIAARDAQRDAIEGLGAQVDSSAALVADLRVSSAIDAIIQRQALNAARVEAIGGDADSDVHLAARERLAAVAEAVADLTPVDPTDGGSILADIAERSRRPDQARLRQTVEADLANDHGGKADTYVAILTVLAVALFLFGLSLTVSGRSRFVLLVPGIAIALVCVAWSVVTSARPVTDVSGSAIADVAEGQRLASIGDLEGAIQRYDDAIADSPDFAAAFARRADATFFQGSTQAGQTNFISITSEEALEDALADLDQALSLGASSDVVTVADAGFFNFLAGDFDRSVELSTAAIELNDSLAAVWFNLGVAEVARGDEDAAEDAYEEGLDVLQENEPSAGTRSQIIAGARTDLSVLRELLDEDDLEDVIAVVVAAEARLADAELAEAVCPDGEVCDTDVDAGDGEVGEATFSRSGPSVFADIEVEGLDDGDDVGVAWYFRSDPSLPFEQAALSFQGATVLDGVVSASTLPVLDPTCPVVGDYLVRLYAGGAFIGEAEAPIGEGEAGTPLGSSFTGLIDPIEGIETCVPEGFIVSEQDVSELDAFTTYGDPEGGILIGLNVTPGSLSLGQDAQLLEETLVEGILPDADQFELQLSARDVEGSFVFLDATAAIGEAGGFLTAAVVASGPDTASRTILITADLDTDDFEALVREVAATVTFTGVDTSAS